jgi:hypothetical protein
VGKRERNPKKIASSTLKTLLRSLCENQQQKSQFKGILYEKLLFPFVQNAQQDKAERIKHGQKTEMVDMVLLPSFDSACRT